MARNLQLQVFKDFTGGLCLTADAFKLARNQTPDALNVDVLVEGGFRQRGGVQARGDVLPSEPQTLLSFVSGATTQVLAQTAEGTVRYGTGAGAWTTTGYTAARKVTGAVLNGRMYLSGPVMQRWDGATMTALGTAWNNDILNPTLPSGTGNGPDAKIVATWKSTLWAANTTESGDAYPSRIRWSHPGHPEDWFDYHYIDIDAGVNGDEIIGLVPFRDHLLVFKRMGIYAVFGAPPEALSVVQITGNQGAVAHEACALTPGGVFFFDMELGVSDYSGRAPRWLFARLDVLMRDRFATGRAGETRVAQVGQRVWVSVPVTSGGCETYVYDPRIQLRGQEDGAWMKYSLDINNFVAVPRGAGATSYYGTVGAQLVELDLEQPWDDFGAGHVGIPSWYRTGWFDVGNPAQKKRWKRPEIVVAADMNATVRCSKMVDYDSTVSRTIGYFSSTAGTTGMVWDEEDWDDGVWGGADGGTKNEIERLSPLGSARAVALRFDGPADGTNSWGVDALTLKWYPRKVRS